MILCLFPEKLKNRQLADETGELNPVPLMKLH